MPAKLKPFAPAKLRRRVFSQAWMLALQFVLGMLLNLVGGDTRGASHVAYIVVLVVHILNAIGLLEGGVYIALKAPSRMAWWGAAAVSLALGAGILTVRTGLDAWSFVMAGGFIAALWLYGALYVRADRAIREHQNS